MIIHIFGDLQARSKLLPSRQGNKARERPLCNGEALSKPVFCALYLSRVMLVAHLGRECIASTPYRTYVSYPGHLV